MANPIASYLPMPERGRAQMAGVALMLVVFRLPVALFSLGIVAPTLGPTALFVTGRLGDSIFLTSYFGDWIAYLGLIAAAIVAASVGRVRVVAFVCAALTSLYMATLLVGLVALAISGESSPILLGIGGLILAANAAIVCMCRRAIVIARDETQFAGGFYRLN